jgi:hypothetical protein
LLAALDQHFPSDVLLFKLGAPFDSEDTESQLSNRSLPFPRAEVPTIFISYGVEMNGHFTSPKPRGVYAGTGLLFRAVFQIPGDPDFPEFKFAVWRLPDLNQAKQDNLKPEAIYDNMAALAFSSFSDKYLASLFKPTNRK